MAKANECPIFLHGSEMWIPAVKRGKIEVLEWLVAEGCQLYPNAFGKRNKD